MPALSSVFDNLCDREPRLRDLEADVKETAAAARKRRRRCANRMARDFEPWLARLVGPDRRDGDPVLAADKALDAAGQHLFNLLPDCRGCGCL